MAGYQFDDESTDEQISLFSAENTVIKAEEKSAAAGQIADVPVTISNNTGFAGFHLLISYDKNCLTPLSVSDGAVLEAVDAKCVSNIADEPDGEGNALPDYVSVYFSRAQNTSKDGELFSLKFKVHENVNVGTVLPIRIDYEKSSLCDENIRDVNAVIEQGSVTVAESADLSDNIYQINDITIMSGSGEIYPAILPNGDFDLDIEIQSLNNGFIPAEIIAAAYDKNGRFISFNDTELNEEMLSKGRCKVHIDKTGKSISRVKVLVWSSKRGMKPLSQIKNV